MALLFVPSTTPIVSSMTGFVAEAWRKLFEGLATQQNANTAALAALTVIGRGAAAAAPVGLAVANAGQLYYVTDFGHLVMWDGAKWIFAPGDVGNGFIRPYGTGIGAPQEVGWQVCNGSTVSYLVVGGATLTTANFVTPVTAGSYFRR